MPVLLNRTIIDRLRIAGHVTIPLWFITGDRLTEIYVTACFSVPKVMSMPPEGSKWTRLACPAPHSPDRVGAAVL
jgi:hypothetical protein